MFVLAVMVENIEIYRINIINIYTRRTHVGFWKKFDRPTKLAVLDKRPRGEIRHENPFTTHVNEARVFLWRSENI